MIDEGGIRFSASIPAADVEKALSQIVGRALEEREQEIDLSLDEVRGKLRDRERQIREEIDSLYDKSIAAKKETEKGLEDLKEKINRKANWYLVPVAAIILLTGIIALWALVGSVALKLRDDVAKTVKEVEDLKDQVSGKQATLKGLGEDLEKLKTQLEDIKKGTAFGQVNGRLDKLDGKIQELSRELQDVPKPHSQPAAKQVQSSPKRGRP